MMKRTVLLAAAMLVAGMLVAGLGFEMPAKAQAQTPDVPDAAQTPPDGSSTTGVTPRSPEASRMLQKAEREGSIRAIVGLRTDFVPEGRINRAAAADQRRGIENAGAGLRADLSGTGFRTLREYDTVPYIALNLTPQAFRAVQNSPRVTMIQEDVAVPADLAESAPVVQAPTMWTHDYTGGGKTIAILDTGVDANHFFFGDRVVEEACFSGNSNCPNGMTTDTTAGAGAPCTYAPEGCEHGTHVAGIAAGNANSAIFGVAPAANIMAVQVFSRFTGKACTDAGETEDPCALTFASDQIAGLEEVFEQRGGHTFSAVNMSLGGGMNTSACDTDARKAAIDNLRSISAATVISSGNSGFTDAVGAPACISSAITVGSTTKPTPTAGDSISSFSNMSPLVDLLAPGSSINSSIPGGGFEEKSGTSMAAPHVSGAWAVLEDWDSGQDVSSLLTRLQMTGTPVTDTGSGGTVTVDRINIADAAGQRPLNDGFSFPREIVGATVSVSGANGGVNGAATRESGEPDHLPANSASLGENSVWYRWTAPASGRVNINTCTSSFDTVLAAYTGGSTFPSLTQVASSDDACSAPNSRGSRISFDATAATTYRIAVAGFRADTRGEGTFTLKLNMQPPPKADYELFNSRESSVRGLFGVPPLADIGPGTNTFATASVDGDSRPVLKFPQGNGLQLFPTSGVTSSNVYTIVALFEFDSVSGFKRIVDFKNGTSDNGLYVQDGRLRFFPHTQRGTTAIPANTYVQVALTRNSAGTVTGYVNGVKQFTITDTAGDAVIKDDALRFFRDNESGGANTEHSAGSVARIRLYDFALTEVEVSALDRQDTIPPR